jgi:hypothetical protein
MVGLTRRTLIVSLCLVALLGNGAARGQSTQQVKPGPKPGVYARDYTELAKPAWKKDFPNLGRYEVLAPSTGRDNTKSAYNCIAHTLRIYNRWVWPGERVADFDKLYGEQGYKRIRKLDYRFNARLDKIVLYAKTGKNGQLVCTHGSRQLTDGTWTSKLGAGPLVRHSNPEAVGGPSYGQPIAVYVKVRKTQATAKPVLLANTRKPGKS